MYDWVKSVTGLLCEGGFAMTKRCFLGFSLIELLIVLAIIMILVALLVPVFASVKETGRMARCASNLHQLQVAAMNYAAGGELPPAISHSDWDEPEGNYIHHHGWISWANWTPKDVSEERAKTPHQPVSSTPNSKLGYSWIADADGIACIQKGGLFPFLRGDKPFIAGQVSSEMAVYICPTFAQQKVCGVANPLRSYSMSTNVGHRLLSDTNLNASIMILFGDEHLTNSSPLKMDGAFEPMFELGRDHRGKRGQVVYVDGHVERL
jgi:prepilin-type processing-associated H-X9-DG protein